MTFTEYVNRSRVELAQARATEAERHSHRDRLRRRLPISFAVQSQLPALRWRGTYQVSQTHA